jgi:hypothetical protein
MVAVLRELMIWLRFPDSSQTFAAAGHEGKIARRCGQVWIV